MVSLTKKDKNPKGGLTASGRRKYNNKTNGNLKPGVKKPLSKMSTTEMKRKGSFLRRHYAGPSKPLKDEKGKPTRHALQACLHGSTQILLINGESKSIQEIVDNKLTCDVWSLNETTQKLEPAKIIGWNKEKSNISEFISIGNNNVCGKYKNIILTRDHKILLNNNWEKAESALGKFIKYITLIPNSTMQEYIYDTQIKFISIAEYGTFKQITKSSYDYKYDITLDKNHNFVANNIIVHNSAWGEPVPTTRTAVTRLAQKGKSLLERAKSREKKK